MIAGPVGAGGERTLSAQASKALLAGYGVPGAREAMAADAPAAALAAAEIGCPVALKLCGDAIAHKTERNLVRLGLADAGAVRAAAGELLALGRPDDGVVALLVAEMVRGRRELIAGVVRDPQFGPCVMLGVGGILAEAVGDVVFAAAPLSAAEARRMVGELGAGRRFLEAFRGEPAVEAEARAAILVGLGRLAVERPEVQSVDVNPLIVRDGRPIAVDALVVLGPPVPGRAVCSAGDVLGRLRPLFHPRGVIVAGASSHPGKFGFAAFHNLVRFGFRGDVYPVNREGGEILGRPCLQSVAEVPERAAELAFVCTPPPANVAMLRACAGRGVRAAFVASGGYGEAGEEGRALERELVRTADELGIVLAGPNGQGVISTPESMCAQMVAPYPPPGCISVASQSGNILSALLNYAVSTGVCVSKAVSTGNSAQTGIADYLAYFAADPETAVALAYLEGVANGRAFIDAVRRLTAAKPLVLLKGGAAAEGQRAAASHTGPFFPGHGLDRIADFHERQDRRYAEAAREASERHRKPVLVATELVYADRAYGNAGPLAVREGGRVCYPSAHRAVAALRAMVDYAVFRGSVG